MWHDHTFNQRKTTTKRAEGWTNFEKKGLSSTRGLHKIRGLEYFANYVETLFHQESNASFHNECGNSLSMI